MATLNKGNGDSWRQNQNTYTMRFINEVEQTVLITAVAKCLFEYAKPHLNKAKHLDIGCWTGGTFSLYQGVTKKSIGLELKLPPLLVAKKYNPKGLFISASAFAIPFQDDYFDIATFTEVIEHLPKDTEAVALREIGRVLRPGGKLFLTTPNMHPLSVLTDPAYFLLGHRHYSIKRLKEILKTSGFEVIFMLNCGGFFQTLRAHIASVWKYLFKREFKPPVWFNYLITKEFRTKKSWWTSTKLAVLAEKIK